jgi:hypothetical protein
MKILIATVGKLLVRPLGFLRSSSEVTRITPSPDA